MREYHRRRGEQDDHADVHAPAEAPAAADVGCDAAVKEPHLVFKGLQRVLRVGGIKGHVQDASAVVVIILVELHAVNALKLAEPVPHVLALSQGHVFQKDVGGAEIVKLRVQHLCPAPRVCGAGHVGRKCPRRGSPHACEYAANRKQNGDDVYQFPFISRKAHDAFTRPWFYRGIFPFLQVAYPPYQLKRNAIRLNHRSFYVIHWWS